MRMKVLLGLALVAILVPMTIISVAQGDATLDPSPTPTFEYHTYLPLVMKEKRGRQYWKGIGNPPGTSESLTNLDTVSWFINWSPHGPFKDPRYIPLVRPKDCNTPEKREQLAAYVEQYPGRVWLFGNEPDINDQDNISPAYCAELYDLTYDAIKAADPTAKIFCCGTAFAATQWLEEFGEEVTRPIDGIHFHGYPCPRDIAQECVVDPFPAFYNRFNMELMKSRLNSFYSYLQTHEKFAGKPVWITEIGILSNLDWDTREEVKTGVMDPLLDYLENEGGFQKFPRVAWFATRYERFNASDVVFPDYTLTILGERWNTYSYP